MHIAIIIIRVIVILAALVGAAIAHKRIRAWADASRAEEEQAKTARYVRETYGDIESPAYLRNGRKP